MAAHRLAVAENCGMALDIPVDQEVLVERLAGTVVAVDTPCMVAAARSGLERSWQDYHSQIPYSQAFRSWGKNACRQGQRCRSWGKHE